MLKDEYYTDIYLEKTLEEDQKLIVPETFNF